MTASYRQSRVKGKSHILQAGVCIFRPENNNRAFDLYVPEIEEKEEKKTRVCLSIDLSTMDEVDTEANAKMETPKFTLRKLFIAFNRGDKCLPQLNRNPKSLTVPVRPEVSKIKMAGDDA